MGLTSPLFPVPGYIYSHCCMLFCWRSSPLPPPLCVVSVVMCRRWRDHGSWCSLLTDVSINQLGYTCHQLSCLRRWYDCESSMVGISSCSSQTGLVARICCSSLVPTWFTFALSLMTLGSCYHRSMMLVLFTTPSAWWPICNLHCACLWVIMPLYLSRFCLPSSGKSSSDSGTIQVSLFGSLDWTCGWCAIF